MKNVDPVRIFAIQVAIIVFLSLYLLLNAPFPLQITPEPRPVQRKFTLHRHTHQTELARLASKFVVNALTIYADECLGSDFVHPSSKKCSNTSEIALTVVDSLDSAWLSGDTELYQRLRSFVEKSFTCARNRIIPFRDLNAHVIGGLISAYVLTGDELFLMKLRDCGEVARRAFGAGSVPRPLIGDKRAYAYEWAPGVPLNDAGSFLLEFEGLASVLEDERFRTYAPPFLECVKEIFESNNGLPLFVRENCKNSPSGVGLTALNAGFLANLLRFSLATGGQAVNEVVQLIFGSIASKSLKTSMKAVNASVSRFDASFCALVPLLGLVEHKQAKLLEKLHEKCNALSSFGILRASGVLQKNYLDIEQDELSFESGLLENLLLHGESLENSTNILEKLMCNNSFCSEVFIHDFLPLKVINRVGKLLMLDGTDFNYRSFVMNDAGHFIPVTR